MIKYDQRFWGATANLSLQCWVYLYCLCCRYYLDWWLRLLKKTCNGVRAFWEEMEPFFVKNANIPSGDFICFPSRLAETGHENRLSSHLPKFGLSTNIPLHVVDIGLPEAYPVLAVSDYKLRLPRRTRLMFFLMGHRNPHYEDFWLEWRALEMGRCVPVGVHADEGTSIKKRLCGITSSSSDGAGVPKTKNLPNDCWAESLGEHPQNENVVFSFAGPPLPWSKVTKPSTHGTRESSMLTIAGFVRQRDCSQHRRSEIGKIYLARLAMKGDWPAFSKNGCLMSHHNRLTTTTEAGMGICLCHLCNGGVAGHAA